MNLFLRLRCNPYLRRRPVRVAAIRGKESNGSATGRICRRFPFKQRKTKSHLPAARDAPESCIMLVPPKQRAQGMPGALPRPQPRMRMKKAYERSHHRSAKRSGTPCAIGFNGFLRALPGDRLSCHRHPAELAPLNLNASVEASGPHDFAVRKLAPSSEAPPASTASRPASVTIAIRPS